MRQPTSEQVRRCEQMLPYFSRLSEPVDPAHGTGFGWDRWKIVRESGLLRMPFETRYGGSGLDLPTTMYLLEELGYHCRDGGLGFATATQLVSVGIAVQRFGSDQQRSKHLPLIISGEAIGAHAITDPAGGSDVLNMSATANDDGDCWVLDGQKMFVTNGPVADLFTIYARTDPTAGPLGLTAFLVERDRAGLRVGGPVATMGLGSAPICTIDIEGCRVPRDHVIGAPGQGFTVLDHVMKWEVLCSFAIIAGEMRRRLETTIRYARQRRQFGSPISRFQSVANKIVDMKIGLETSRRWLYDVAGSVVDGADVTAELAIAKLIASEANLASSLSAVQIFGGRGYLLATGLASELQNAVGGTIYSGTSEIQRVRIGRMLGL